MKCYPKLHYPPLLSRYYPAFFGITAPLSPRKNLPRFFFFGRGEGLEQHQKSPRDNPRTPVPWNLGVLGSARTPNSCCSRGVDLIPLFYLGIPNPRDFGEFGEPVPPVLPLDGQIQHGSVGNSRIEGSEGGIYSLPRDFANTSDALG